VKDIIAPFGTTNRLSLAPFAAVVALALASGACAPRTAPSTTGTRPAARLLGVFAAWANTLPAIDGLPVGSLSGLAYDAAHRRWVAASDEIQKPRLLWFDLALGRDIRVTPVAVTPLTLTVDVPADTLTALDMEGLALFPDGSFAVSHEGHIDRGGVARQPRVLRVTREGVVTTVIRPRDHFTIDPADRTHGVRHNLGLEGLTRTPDGRLVAAIEQPLAQDGPVSTTSEGGLVRFAEFVDQRGTWTPGREWTYRLDPTRLQAGYVTLCEDGANGLSSILALDAMRFLVVERACLLGAPKTPAYNTVRVYEASFATATDVSTMASLAGQTPLPATKRLIADLAGWIPSFPPSLATLSNIEGMSFGPPGPTGERTVMLVSDDNFRPTQTTAFIWFALP
jgi:hypothetical protein